MKYKWKPVLAAMLASFCLFSSPLTALATDNTVSTIEDEMVHNTEGAAEAGSAETQTGESETPGSLPVQADEEPGWPSGPSIVAESGIVMEVSTGTILYSKNMHAQYYPASITKIMTALLAMENCELDEQVAAKVLPLAGKIGAAMKQALGCSGFNVVQNNGETAGQTVFHFHVHIIPRYEGGPAMVTWEPGKADSAEFAEISSSIKEVLQS